VQLEHAEAEARTGLAREQADDLLAARLEQVGRLEEDPLPRLRRRLRPLGKCTGRRLDGALRVLALPRGHVRDHVPAVGIAILERPAAGGVEPLAADVELRLAHLGCLARRHLVLLVSRVASP
jgi:hypothetical protein